jgi:putative component of membrane protein insertase Oxa1/YidC/SpoIIIJ protein YidD
MRCERVLVALLLLGVAGLPATCPAQFGMKGPAAVVNKVEEYGRGSDPVITFYQTVLSPVKGGDTCPMYPSCSQFARIVFASHGPLQASLLTFDRLLRCGHELWMYPEIIVHRQVRWHDPVPDRSRGERFAMSGSEYHEGDRVRHGISSGPGIRLLMKP